MLENELTLELTKREKKLLLETFTNYTEKFFAEAKLSNLFPNYDPRNNNWETRPFEPIYDQNAMHQYQNACKNVADNLKYQIVTTIRDKVIVTYDELLIILQVFDKALTQLGRFEMANKSKYKPEERQRLVHRRDELHNLWQDLWKVEFDYRCFHKLNS